MTPRAQSRVGIPVEAAIADHGLIGDMRTAALVDRWGRMNWLCWPRFDAPPLFRRLLDPHRGGCWQIAPAAPFEARRRYLPDTNIIETTFRCADGVAVATDFMAAPADDRWGSQVIRIVEAATGSVPIQLTVRATEGFIGQAMTPQRDGSGRVRFGDDERAAALFINQEVQVSRDDVSVLAAVEPGRPLVSVVAARAITSPLLEHALTERIRTAHWWQGWTRRCELPQVHRHAVTRSALLLKLLQHEPTNTLVAAPTTSLPEHVGGSRNWDYRYTWLRDSSLMVLALQRLGQHDEAMGYWDSLSRTAARHGTDLSVAYALGGDPVPEESVVELPGYKGSRPVRVGNAAARQRQHDTYGHVLAAAAHCYDHMNMDVAAPAEVLGNIANLAADRWNRPDNSIWETRGAGRHHTYSRLMCWLALERAVHLADHDALSGNASHWARQRDACRRDVLQHAWNPAAGTFTGTVGGDDVDAAALVAALIGFLPADDSRCRATRQTVTAQLGDRGLIRRYRRDDGLDGDEGVFLLCTLWLADTHTLDGDPSRGEELLERVLAASNDLGLLAEEADPASDEPLGNFPQGLTHLGVIQTALRLDTYA